MLAQVTALRLDGLIADVEDWTAPAGQTWRPWSVATAAERAQIAQRLGAASATTSVGLTSFPAHHMVRSIAAASTSRRMWGTPQLYGLRSTTIAQLQNMQRQWAGWFQYVIPSLAAWDRTPAEERTYLANFVGDSGALFWAFVPSGELFNIIRDHTPGGPQLGAPSTGGATPPPPPAATTGGSPGTPAPMNANQASLPAPSAAQNNRPAPSALQPSAAPVMKDPAVANARK